jgi:aminoglycoside phosphotransferase
VLNIDVEASTKRFMERLRSGYFEVKRSQNDEVDYTEEKQQRDTQAVYDFLATDLADEIIRMK